MVTVSDVRIKHGNIWINANEMQIKAYKNYKQRYIQTPLITTFHIFKDGTYYEVVDSSTSVSHISAENIVKSINITISRTENNSYMPVYISEQIINYIPTSQIHQEASYGIIDWNDIKLFLITAYSQASWVDARPYQTWAYIDFMYSNVELKYYASYGSYVFEEGDEDINNNNQNRTYTPIDINTYISPNIIFSIKRNRDNGSISFVRDNGEQVRICDDEKARNAYLGYYTRITMDVGIIITPPPSQAHHDIPSNIITTETNIEDDQCILCYKYKKNITFLPCNHNIVCSNCYIKLDKGGRECPICKGVINTLKCQ